MNRTAKLTVGKGALVGAIVLIGGGLTLGAAMADSGTDDAEASITGAALDRASTAALANTGEGTVTDTEVDDEESYYEVEVTLADGNQVDVQLDENFMVVGSAPDSSTDE